LLFCTYISVALSVSVASIFGEMRKCLSLHLIYLLLNQPKRLPSGAEATIKEKAELN